eukprot:TRINITY_DN19123_c0_g1_i1.p1 TRINITY_DN19123_c0_g1~~TRINITY_DN19123_c0_g1_i1.p1  ORF type:complete len:750 (-),score=84.42 TRINITY_DN19123_c0_g1_i1:1204-3159(-)
MNGMTLRMDRFGELLSESNPLKEKVETLETKVAKLSKDTQDLDVQARVDRQRLDATARELNEEFDTLTADFNKNIDQTNEHLNAELDKIVSYCNQIHDEVKARKDEIREVRRGIKEVTESKAADAIQLHNSLQAAGITVSGLIPTSSGSSGSSSPTSSSANLASSSQADIAGYTGSASRWANRQQQQETRTKSFNVTVNKTAMAGYQKKLDELTAYFERLKATVEGHGNKLKDFALLTDLNKKADVSYCQAELGKKVDLKDHLRQVGHVDELFSLHDKTSRAVDTLTKELKDTAITHLLDDAFDKRLGTIYSELFRLDKNKCDRTEIEEWIAKSDTGGDAPTSLRFKCLSCNRNAGPLVETLNIRRSGADFPPSSMFISSLQHKQGDKSEDGTATMTHSASPTTTLTNTHTVNNHPKKVRKKPLVKDGANSGPPGMVQAVDPNAPARKKLNALYDWLKGRHEEESVRQWVQSELKITPEMVGMLDKKDSTISEMNPNSTVGRDGRFYIGVAEDGATQYYQPTPTKTQSRSTTPTKNNTTTSSSSSSASPPPTTPNRVQMNTTPRKTPTKESTVTPNATMIKPPSFMDTTHLSASDLENDTSGGDETDTTTGTKGPLEGLKRRRMRGSSTPTSSLKGSEPHPSSITTESPGA